MRQYLKLFKENHLLTKQEILYSIDKYIEHCKESYIEEDWSIIKRDNMIGLCYQFKSTIERAKIPQILNKWYFYDYNFNSDSIQLNLYYCEDIQFDGYGEISYMESSEVFELIKVKCEYLSIEEFAFMFKVKVQTVIKWIKNGRIRSVKLYGNDWLIPKIADKPKRKFESADYYWSEKIRSDDNQFAFLEKCSHVYIYQDDTNKEMYSVILNDLNDQYIGTLALTKMQREKLEYFLISLPEVRCITASECIKYVSIKKEIHNKICDNEKLVSASENEDDDQEDKWLEYGAVIVTKGVHKGRIGYYDCESDFSNKGVVYWGDVYLCRDHYELIKYKYLSNNISTLDLINRIEILNKEIAGLRIERKDYYLCTQLLSELLFVTDILMERYISVKYLQKERNMKIFISHATNDLTFARCLATDIMEKGYDVFLDDWSIDLGENIINKINEGLEESQILIPIISKHFLESIFCLDEWTSFYVRFAKIRKSSILPLIIDDSDIPAIMSAIKYCRVKDGYSYQRFLSQLTSALKKHKKN
jgi:excisionase family DNA binding protein